MKLITNSLIFLVIVLLFSYAINIPKQSRTGIVIDKHPSTNQCDCWHIEVKFDSTIGVRNIKVTQDTYNKYNLKDKISFNTHTSVQNAVQCIVLFLCAGVFVILIVIWAKSD